jgi:ABC-type Fe3+-hydroxamate transport system substrate-binding protein
MQKLKKPTIIETIRLNTLCWFDRWQDEVREDGQVVGGVG